jgi:hypothetical protein
LGFPESPVLCDPGRCIFHRLSGQPAAVYAAIDFTVQQPRGFQHPQVLGNRGQRHGKRLGQFRDHRFAVRQPRQDRSARGIGQRAERGIEYAVRIVNHTV